MKVLKSIFSFFLIGAVLFSSVGFSVSHHYCMGMLKSEKFYSPIEKCASESSHLCEMPQGDHFDHGCCDSDFIAIPGISFVKNLKDDNISFIQFEPLLFQSEFEAIIIPEFIRNDNFDPHERHYSHSGASILVLQQRFLI